MFYSGRWYEARVFEMDLLNEGYVIEGAAIIEAPSTTFVVPPGYAAYLDTHRVFWLQIWILLEEPPCKDLEFKDLSRDYLSRALRDED